MTPSDPSVVTVQIDDDNRPFFEGAARGELLIQRCAACGRHRHPPQIRCPVCHSDKVDWTRSSGAGTLWSFVVAHPPLPGPFLALAPVTVALVALDDPIGIRLLGTLVESEGASPAIGDAVEVVFTSVAGGPVLPHFRLPGSR